jgi:hypothetical protein
MPRPSDVLGGRRDPLCEPERHRPGSNPSDIGRGKLYDPHARPVALVAGGRLTMRLRRYEGASQPDKGFIRVVADERFGYDARAARARPTPRPACASGGAM